MAVSTAMSICKIVFQTSFFIFFFPFFFSGSTFRKRQGRCAPLSFSLSVFQWLISHLPFLMNGSAVFLLTQCKDTKKIGKMQQLSRITCILVPNHVHPCQESCASLSRIPLIPIFVAMYRQLRPDAVGATSRRIARCIGTQFWGHRAHSYLLCGLAGGQEERQKCECECEFEMFFNVT